jgi:threonine dehydrogenase-like Zn-dependent dehydrogenase
MRATLIYGTGDVRVGEVPDPVIAQPTDALVRVLRSCICGSDLWSYGSKAAVEHGDRIGHEFLGVIEEVGSQVSVFRRGDVVVAPFVWSDGTCDFCREGLQTSCRHGGNWGRDGVDGGQGEAVRVPQAQGTLVKLPVGEDSALLPSLLSLSDVFPTGHHCAKTAGVNERTTVTVIGDGAGGDGTHTVLECVGLEPAMDTAFGVVRAGGTISRVGAPQYKQVSFGIPDFLRNITLTGGVAPARAYIEELLPDILDGKIEPGRVFDRTVTLGQVPDGYRAMAEREALKVMIAP